MLGKGLSALLPNRHSTPVAEPAPPTADVPTAAAVQAAVPAYGQLQSIPLDQIEPNTEQPRLHFDLDRLEELAISIRENGLLQPITVQATGPKQYRIIAGERRWRAAGIAGLQEVTAIVRNIDEHRNLELALIENIQREDLNPIEIAMAFQALADQHGLQHDEIADRTGKDRSTVTNFLRLLRLPSYVQAAVRDGLITAGHARALLNLPDKGQQEDLCNRVIDEHLSVRAVERLVKELNSPPPPEKAKPQPKTFDANVRAALDEMAASLGTKITLKPKNATSGRLEIEYFSQEDLDRIYSVITKQ